METTLIVAVGVFGGYLVADKLWKSLTMKSRRKSSKRKRKGGRR